MLTEDQRHHLHGFLAEVWLGERTVWTWARALKVAVEEVIGMPWRWEVLHALHMVEDVPSELGYPENRRELWTVTLGWANTLYRGLSRHQRSHIEVFVFAPEARTLPPTSRGYSLAQSVAYPIQVRVSFTDPSIDREDFWIDEDHFVKDQEELKNTLQDAAEPSHLIGRIRHQLRDTLEEFGYSADHVLKHHLGTLDPFNPKRGDEDDPDPVSYSSHEWGPKQRR